MSSREVFWRQSYTKETELLFEKAVSFIGWQLEKLAPGVRGDNALAYGELGQVDFLDLAKAGERWTTVYQGFSSIHLDRLAAKLSDMQAEPVLFIVSVDHDWGYDLYHKGKSVDKFWNRYDPEFKGSRQSLGDPAAVGKVLDVDPHIVAPYLQQISWDDPPRKAHSDDEYDLTDRWVRETS